jgi:hypothetical protein
MNNLLRACSHPSEIYYIQPFFKDLFLAVRSLQLQTNLGDYVCYRGGFVARQEIEQLQNNVGGIVKNLSFLSTSLSEETAQSFKKNVVFEIIVSGFGSPASHLDYKYDFGYASVKKHSYFFEEEEVIFNPSSTFRVLEVKNSSN